MANVDGTFYSGESQRPNTTPVSPPNAGDDPVYPINPPGTTNNTLYKLLGDVTDSDFIGKNGMVPVVNDENVLTLENLNDKYVTIATAQTITGAKIFSNALLVQEANTPILRLKTANNTQAVLNFRNSTNEDQAGLQFDAGVGKLSLLTRTANTDIEIFPNGTGSILLPNVPSGTGGVLMLNGSNKLVKGSGGIVQTSGSFTPILLDGTAGGGGGTYTYTVVTAYYVKTGEQIYFSIFLNDIDTTGTPSSILTISGLPFSSSISLSSSFVVNLFNGSSLTTTQVSLLSAVNTGGSIATFFDKSGSGTNLSSITFTNGVIWISGIYL